MAAPSAKDLDLDGDTLREECGVFGIFGHPDASAVVALGLHALQHRGQEAAGIVSFDGEIFIPSAGPASSAIRSPTARRSSGSGAAPRSATCATRRPAAPS